jgi:hypothetical protein
VTAPHDAESLVALLSRRGVALHVPELSAASVVEGLMPFGAEPHIEEVVLRLETIAADEQEAAWPLKLAALVHEHHDHDTLERSLLEDGIEAAPAALVADVVSGFGELWKTRGDEDAVKGYADRHGGHLSELLRFEVAHEGRATDAMRTAARAGGLEAELDGWLRRLAPR